MRCAADRASRKRGTSIAVVDRVGLRAKPEAEPGQRNTRAVCGSARSGARRALRHDHPEQRRNTQLCQNLPEHREEQLEYRSKAGISMCSLRSKQSGTAHGTFWASMFPAERYSDSTWCVLDSACALLCSVVCL